MINKHKIDEFGEWLVNEQGCSDTTVKNYKAVLSQVKSVKYKGSKLIDHLNRFLREKGYKTMYDSACRRYLEFLEYSKEDRDRIIHIKASKSDSQEAEQKRIERIMSDDDMMNIVAEMYVIGEYRIGIFYEFLATYGMRVGGLLNLKIDDVEEDKFRFWSKGKYHQLPALPSFYDGSNLLAKVRSLGLKSGEKVFPAGYFYYYKKLIEISSKVIGKRITTHAFRASVITRLLKKGQSYDNTSLLTKNKPETIKKHYGRMSVWDEMKLVKDMMEKAN